MKQLFFALALVAGSSFAANAQTAAPAPDPKAPVFQFVKGETHDFGALKEGDAADYAFEFKNVGKSPMIITNASASCGCTVPEWPKAPIAPGKKGKITVHFDTKGKSGPFNKSIWIESNAVPSKGQQRYEIQIKGTVNPATAAPQS